MEIAVAPVDADSDGTADTRSRSAAARAEVVDGYVVYPSRDASTVDRATPAGIEDFILFDTPPRAAELAYSVTLGGRARSLRLVGGTLEVLDAAGAPRLRAAPPFVVGADGDRREAELVVEGCEVDTNPRPPWGRSHPDPGARVCTVLVRWPEVAYPALVDPAWAGAGFLTHPRWWPSAAVLPSGRVIVAGSHDEYSCKPMTAEVYDPATSTWAATGSPPSPACFLVLTGLASGRVLGTGDYARVYDEATGTWDAAGMFPNPRFGHTATLLDSGEVLVAGGRGGTNPNYHDLKNADVFDPQTKSWHGAASMKHAHVQHTATRLANGRVLVTGGDDGGSGTDVAEVYDPTTDAWSEVGPMTATRAAHTATLLPSGDVLVVGGFGDAGVPLATAETFDPVAGTFAWAGQFAVARDYHSANLLPTGEVLVAGGAIDHHETPTDSVEIWSSSVGFRSATGLGEGGRYLHTATNLTSGAVLVAGGDDGPNFTEPLSNSEITADLSLALGSACTAGVDCTSGFCSGAVCCDSACAAPCQVCSMAFGAPSDGTCAVAPPGSPGRPSCAPYLCDGTNTSCGSTCASSSDCASSAHCNTGSSKCVETGFDGAACSTGATCLSGFCSDGVCCNTPCDATCQSCSAVGKGQGADGICGDATPDTDPHSDCLPSTCSDSLVVELSCDGHGRCANSTEEECYPYGCGASACLTHCTTANDCAPKVDCVSGSCVPRASNGSSGPTGAGGAGTGGDGGVVAEGGCGCRIGEQPSISWWSVGLALALAAQRHRRFGRRLLGPDA